MIQSRGIVGAFGPAAISSRKTQTQAHMQRPIPRQSLNVDFDFDAIDSYGDITDINYTNSISRLQSSYILDDPDSSDLSNSSNSSTFLETNNYLNDSNAFGSNTNTNTNNFNNNTNTNTNNFNMNNTNTNNFNMNNTNTNNFNMNNTNTNNFNMNNTKNAEFPRRACSPIMFSEEYPRQDFQSFDHRQANSPQGKPLDIQKDGFGAKPEFSILEEAAKRAELSILSDSINEMKF